jgi:hypothetical protein
VSHSEVNHEHCHEPEHLEEGLVEEKEIMNLEPGKKIYVKMAGPV